MINLSILADTITADMGFLPGLAIFGPVFGLPLSVLAAVLERPFLTRAGVGRFAIWYSLQANLMSLLVGYLLLPLAIPALYSVGPLWLPIAVFISVVVERKYLMWRARSAGFNCRWGWVSWANIVSAVALVGVLLMSVPFNTYANRESLRPYLNFLTGVGVVVSVAAFATAFIVPALGKQKGERPVTILAERNSA
jgi:hypothetical protein